ncbi:Asp23/Gls24 family envelope stress response protein [Modestobacter sp. I12A-02628]|uniref:Asp23/Gls24 family envelope stress response protein n=1 Tax=Goekera deserti TaxID=2497753 RepID=A0A7K3WIN6_9ACTN|nr:Asp23/Gls24 family envelope stress response protein [Goekera deserti]MPQ96637.1 Asp23/Gls24 family envelope stress response protein [Goekera deserti]NDI47051.1 Asp23/Gls24 family envelope stress response protein [Goekera deserti]NEL56287.1 Asp23/Gls24 family envelope stress response protein [Goekera deserti]
MSTSTTSATGTSTGNDVTAGATRPAAVSAQGSDSQGRTTIADTVVAKIAGMAARELSGVYRLGGGAARAFGAIRERIPGSGGPNVTQGVSVEVGEKQAAIDIEIVVEYGVAIADLASAIRRNVITAVERMTGLDVVEVNIAVDDVRLPTDESEPEQHSRVE